ncbi:hypothetical protein PV458_02055 [Streptomyces sp. MN03-5084-2B]|nr:hypothetical protein [Streptomyces sp. MN03-5084-2B]
MSTVESFFAGPRPTAEPEPLTLVDAAPVIACTVDVAEGAALGFAWIARAAQRAHQAGRQVATATRDIGFHPASPVPGPHGAGPGLTAHQLIGIRSGPA